MSSEMVTLGQAGSTVIPATQLSFVIFALREEFAFLFQTFSRNDPPGKAPPSRGRSVFNKKKKKFNPVVLREAAPPPPPQVPDEHRALLLEQGFEALHPTPGRARPPGVARASSDTPARSCNIWQTFG